MTNMTSKFEKSASRIAFIRARWHADIVDKAYDGFCAKMTDLSPASVTDVYNVPGAFEAPLLAKRLAKTGNYDAIVVAALVVDGGIYRHDFVADAVVSGLMQAQLETEVPMFSVSLTPHHFHASDDHVKFYTEHFVKKGGEAAQAVSDVLNIDIPAPVTV
ncbi:6,7-dimethyl-8-ribityllumazine synthase [Pacificibacter marinus]|jgi:6,7-dimethyl-8-ribityllumazine synthase|uniref:6,7-dimethyl-8-ribityllumazine synthase n=1 Tax=Pacificibacter marinus TaxID=658057 RepID=A0A1Y5THI8_9RHOB|nr:6,7-dimethyl-8-ribityllumazine synthase [Pacificibacter marinus]SEL26325.1 6,7-dimethyl-8-ribityllumazine synthase [Pacificibacter marinus]SLN64422.1 6,7-dimethyl-8-ribityllumazine synthase 2 [Pacificibacter marinus]